ncbi:hypothetical protein Taro_008221 [Colocasia esculenta]|uniref:Uncharacterized protein n=1 Tax=Colocasia esculenta TaxID=4460 RepID=A0A843TWZ7_COLES|nr:hypothetical protein [Colocasia esculenta]
MAKSDRVLDRTQPTPIRVGSDRRIRPIPWESGRSRIDQVNKQRQDVTLEVAQKFYLMQRDWLKFWSERCILLLTVYYLAWWFTEVKAKMMGQQQKGQGR